MATETQMCPQNSLIPTCKVLVFPVNYVLSSSVVSIFFGQPKVNQEDLKKQNMLLDRQYFTWHRRWICCVFII